MACERKLLESEATTGFFVLLGTKGKKETLEWCMKANLIASRYECPRCKKEMRLQERKGTVDSYDGVAAASRKIIRTTSFGVNQSWLFAHFILPSPPAEGCGSPVVKVSNHGRHVMSSIQVPLKTRRVGQRCTLNLSRAETSSRWCGVVVRRGGASSGVVHVT
ncbi:uncharacterized protein TNCV_2312811 [Trichonephila clavipes]|nr:uncharacterized protein TNCV_2312811 [Trichonephila clavipes]